MPLARASPANSCFQVSNPAALLPHWAASAGEVGTSEGNKGRPAKNECEAEDVHREIRVGAKGARGIAGEAIVSLLRRGARQRASVA